MKFMNNYCTFEAWNIEDLVDSYNNTCPTKKKKLVIYKRQRNIVWKEEQKKELIQSIKEGYPVGALLLYKSKEKSDTGITEYLLVDGLQRSSTILEYYKTPTKYVEKSFFENNNNFQLLYEKIITKKKINREEIINILCNYIKERDGFEEKNGFSSSKVAKFLLKECSIEDFKFRDDIEEILIPIMEDVKESSNIANTQIPVIIYNGDINNLPEIFHNINKQGTQLSKYEVYSAVWSKEEFLINIKNREIIDFIIKRYEEIQDKGFEIQDFDEENIDKYNQKYSVFEYIFGLSKLIKEKYKNSNLFADSGDSSIDSIIFNLCSMCIQKDTKKMAELHNDLRKYNIDEFEKALIDSIDIVYTAIKPYIDLKLNSKKATAKKSKEIYHRDFQLVALIASVFNNKYKIQENICGKYEIIINNKWNNKIRENINSIKQYYLYDIIKNTFSSRVDTTAKNIVEKNVYFEDKLEREDWETVLNYWFNEELKKHERKRNITSNTKLLLKYIYAHKLSSYDESGLQEFHIEHIIAVEELKAHKIGLPINCIANLGLLKSEINIKKKTLNIYDYYKDKVNKGEVTEEESIKLIEDAEEKLILKKEMLDTFNNVNDDENYKKVYVKFLEDRFKKIKDIFFEIIYK